MGVERLISGLAASLSLMLAAAPVLAQTAPASEFDQGGKICIGSQGQVNAEPLPDWIGPALAAMDQTPAEMTFSFRQVGADRVLYATGEIDENAAAHLQAALDRFGPINEIHFNSPGGDSAQGEAVDQLLEESVHNQAFRNKVLLAYRMFRGMPPRRRPHKSWARLVLSGCGCRKNEGMAGAIPSGSSC